MNSPAELTRIAAEIRKDILKMSFQAKASHLTSALSMVEILTALYFGGVANVDPLNPHWEDRDRILISKGHGGSALYATLARRGFFPKEELNHYYQNGALLGGHTEYRVPGVEISTGSLGHGLSIGLGMALAAKHDKKTHRIFALLSDAECQEGEIWQALLVASHHRLDNLVLIVDYNKFQAIGKIEDVVSFDPLHKKFEAFGCRTRECRGHRFSGLLSAFSALLAVKGQPKALIAHTVIGQGVSFMEGDLDWHYKSLSEKEFARAMVELSAFAKVADAPQPLWRRRASADTRRSAFLPGLPARRRVGRA